MTRQQFDQLLAEVVQNFDFQLFADKCKEKAIKSGAINLEDWDFENGRYLLPKAMLNAIFQEAERMTRTLDKETQSTANSIYNHL